MVEVNLSSEKSHKEKNKNKYDATRKVGIFRHRIWTQWLCG
jgi:hypothetical protein